MDQDTKIEVYKCEKCNREFKRKSYLSCHMKRKTPCVTTTPNNTQTDDKKIDKLPPLVKWSGGKGDEIKKFKHHIPNDFKLYLEPFVGGGAVYFHLCPEKAVLTDVHSELIDFYKCIKQNKSQDIWKFMEDHPNEEKVYYDVRSMDHKNMIDNGSRFYYLRKTCYRGMLRYNKKGGFNVPYGRYKTCNYSNLLDDRYRQLMTGSEFHIQSFEHIFQNYNSSENFMFLDPPYDSEFTDYGYCKFGKEEHKKLAEHFKNTNIRCLMVIGKTPFIEELYKEYIIEEYDKKYRFKLHSGRIGNEINTIHLVIKNYP